MNFLTSPKPKPFSSLPLFIIFTIAIIAAHNRWLLVLANDKLESSPEIQTNISRIIQSNFLPSSSSRVLRDIISGIQTPPLVLDAKGGIDHSKPALINVSLHIETMRNVADEVTLDFYVIQSWFDQRLIQVLG